MVSKRHRLSPVTKRQLRLSRKRSQVKYRKKSLEVRRAVSKRGTQHKMEHPAMDQPQQPQNLFQESTAIRRFKYYLDDNRLRIWWLEGGVYDYYNVPESVFNELVDAHSKGRYAYYNIRTSYEFKRIR